MEHPAHMKKTAEGSWEIQTVAEHCRRAAELAKDALSSVQLGKAAYLGGMIHDMGKCKEEYAQYLFASANGENPRRGSVNHSFAAVRYLLENFHGPSPDRLEDIACEILAYAAGAHHGLFDCVDEGGNNGFAQRKMRENIGYGEAVDNFFAEIISKDALATLYDDAVGELAALLEKLESISQNMEELQFHIGLVARLLLSAVIEGDRRDTDEFMNGTVYPPGRRGAKKWNGALHHMEQKLGELQKDDSPIARAREEISQRCRAAEKPGGIYQLNLPTGAGKTLSSLRYALAHSEIFGKDRIFFVLPLLAIIEQNAKILKEYVGEDAVVTEHHSNVVEEGAMAEETPGRRELMWDNWGSPILITTLVQMLNTMFSGKTGAIRRFQALCNSVVVLDEIQSVPTKNLSQFNTTLRFLSQICGVTVILCSATQPLLEAAKRPISQDIPELVPMEEELCLPFRRTAITDAGGMTLDEIGDFAEEKAMESSGILIICNQKSQAQFLYHRLLHLGAVYHLSASMCTAHRRSVLQEMRERQASQRVICVSTQVMEAGVDISFGCVIRFAAGMDSVVQAAGRCNRNGELSVLAPVYVVTCLNEDLGSLQDIKTGRDVTLSLLDQCRVDPTVFHGDMASPEGIRQYYWDFYRATAPIQDGEISRPVRDSLYSLQSGNQQLSAKNSRIHNGFFMHQAFRLAGDLFSVFPEDTVEVLVPYGQGEEVIADLCSERAKWDFAFAKAAVQRGKQYTISVYAHQYRRLEQAQGVFLAGNTGPPVLLPQYYNRDTGFYMQAENTTYTEV